MHVIDLVVISGLWKLSLISGITHPICIHSAF